MSIIRVLSNVYNLATRWSTRANTNGYFRLLKQRIRQFLINLSGDEITDMLKDVLTKPEISSLSAKYLNALREISVAVNNSSIIKPKRKHHFIRPLRLAGITKRQVNELGFRCGKKLWRSCLNRNGRHLGGRSRMPNDLINEIREHMENLSNIAANKTIVIRTFSQRDPCVNYKKKTISKRNHVAMYRQTTLNEAFRQFKEQAQNLNPELRDRRLNLNFSVFHKKVGPIFKKPFKLTDLCTYCEMQRGLKRDIKLFMVEHADYDQEFDTNKILTYLRNNPSETSALKIEKVELFLSVEYHKSIAARQRKSYNRDRLDPILLNGKILIELDYKQKMLLGQGPRQWGSEFFEGNKKKVLCLGFGIFFVDRTPQNQPFVNVLNIDIITDYEGQDAGDVTRIFKHVMLLPEFIEIDQPEFKVWSDSGSQFRCKEFVYFCTNYLARQNKSVTLNFFAERHGKNMRDAHFSVVSRAFKYATHKNQKGLNSAQEVVDALNSSYIYLNEEKIEKNKKFSKSIAVYYNPANEQKIERNERKIENFYCYYHFKTIRENLLPQDRQRENRKKMQMKSLEMLSTDCIRRFFPMEQ